MENEVQRIAIVGASSLLGKELAEVLTDQPLGPATVLLLDGEDAAGQVTAAGDEITILQPLDTQSFDGVDFAFFTGDSALTHAHWQAASAAGASLIDLTGTLIGEKDMPLRAPWVEGSLGSALEAQRRPLDLGATALVAAHPVAVMLALIAARLASKLSAANLAATLFEPASEHGKLAMDELHQQTVSLLSFQTLPREQYDAQVAFNLLPTLGENARIHPETSEHTIQDHYDRLSGGRLSPLSLQLIQAPVFHGYTASVLVELTRPATVEQLEAALAGPPIDLVREDSDPPSNLSATGQDGILVRARAASDDGTRFWLWLAADNLKLAALNAIACAMELKRLRPRGKVQ